MVTVKAEFVKEKAQEVLEGAEFDVKVAGNSVFVLATLKNGLVLSHGSSHIEKPGEVWLQVGVDLAMDSFLAQLTKLEHYALANAVMAQEDEPSCGPHPDMDAEKDALDWLKGLEIIKPVLFSDCDKTTSPKSEERPDVCAECDFSVDIAGPSNEELILICAKGEPIRGEDGKLRVMSVLANDSCDDFEPIDD